jgi:pyruvate dehydrogenase E1 component
MGEVVDGDYQKYSVEPGSYTRKHFFGKYPELLELVNHFTDEQIHKLLRGGHDTRKVYTAYKAAMDHKGSPTVILAKTIKGYGLGEAGEGKNITHQQKKLNEKELREFRTRFQIPLNDEEVVETPFYRPAADSKETQYLLERRKKLGGFLPARVVTAPTLETPKLDYFTELTKGGSPTTTTGAFGRMLAMLLRHKNVGKKIVPIIPDEARTFGLDALFKDIGIYAPKGQLYEPVDKESLLYYNETKNGQILEEGITEAGSMSSFIAAGTAYATHGVNMIPFYIYYSMFGFQRIGDQMWLAGDIKAKGFLLGATYGRTTLNGEGLQHQDGHSLLTASTIPTLLTYDPAFGYEVATIISDGLQRMYEEGEEIFYYLTLYNEKYAMPAMPEGCREGILKGLYKFKSAPDKGKHYAQIFGSGPIIHQALRAQTILAEKYGVAADVWSATNYKWLRNDALQTRRWNMLHPTKTPKVSYLQNLLKNEKGPFIAVSDNMKIVPDQIAPWVPGGLMTLGTDAEMTVIATLYALAEKGELEMKVVEQAIKDLDVSPEKAHAALL